MLYTYKIFILPHYIDDDDHYNAFTYSTQTQIYVGG